MMPQSVHPELKMIENKAGVVSLELLELIREAQQQLYCCTLCKRRYPDTDTVQKGLQHVASL